MSTEDDKAVARKVKLGDTVWVVSELVRRITVHLEPGTYVIDRTSRQGTVGIALKPGVTRANAWHNKDGLPKVTHPFWKKCTG